jgi:hypothetical protein
MNIIKLQKKYPQFQQGEIFGLQDAFRKLDVDDKGYLDESTVIKGAQQSEHQPYDVVRQALKEVELDSSRRVELDDYVDVCSFSDSVDGNCLLTRYSLYLNFATPRPPSSACRQAPPARAPAPPPASTPPPTPDTPRRAA